MSQVVMGLGGGVAALRRFGIATAANAAMMAVFALIQALTWNGKIYWLRPSPHADAWDSGGPFVCHSHLAEYLNMGLGFALASLLIGVPAGPSRGRGRWLVAAYASGVLTVGVLASNSRGGFLAMSVAVVAMLAMTGRVARRYWACLGMSAGIVAVLLLALGDASSYSARLATILDPSSKGYATRFEIWGAAMRAWRQHPVWGSGLGTFAAATSPYVTRGSVKFFARAENEYIDLLVEGGAVGFGLGLLLLLGVARLVGRALRAAGPCDRCWVLGAMFGLVALAMHSLSDFGPHVPGVSVTAVILLGRLARLGLDAPVLVPANGRAPALGRLAVPVLPALGAALVASALSWARVEALLAATDLPPPGTSRPTAGHIQSAPGQLDRRRDALERALTIRPDWAEGHLRLGLTHLGLYERDAAEWIGGDERDPRRKSAMADPLWLIGVARGAASDGEPPIPELLRHEPIRRHLVPAARSFLEARRCGPTDPLVHAHLAAVAFLLVGDSDASGHAGRALALAGGEDRLLDFTTRVAVRIGDLELAARGWNAMLRSNEECWPEVADMASESLSSDQILDRVVPSGRLALRFSERLYAAPVDRPARDQFLLAAADRLHRDRDAPEAERLHLEGRAWAGLGDRERATDRMERALAIEPANVVWRAEYAASLILWGKLDEGHGQAVIAAHFTPDDPEIRRLLDLAAEALSRGVVDPDPAP